jgi:hypothetical protein
VGSVGGGDDVETMVFVVDGLKIMGFILICLFISALFDSPNLYIQLL